MAGRRYRRSSGPYWRGRMVQVACTIEREKTAILSQKRLRMVQPGCTIEQVEEIKVELETPGTHPARSFKGTLPRAVLRRQIKRYKASWPAETATVKCRFCGVWPVRRLLASRTRHGPARGHGLKATGLRVRKQLTLNQGKQPRFGRFG